jgi:hypothetical protein
VAQEKVAGSSPVGHPLPKSRVCRGLLKAERNGELYERQQQEVFGEGVAGIGPASRLVALVFPRLPTHHIIYQLHSRVPQSTSFALLWSWRPRTPAECRYHRGYEVETVLTGWIIR